MVTLPEFSSPRQDLTDLSGRLSIPTRGSNGDLPVGESPGMVEEAASEPYISMRRPAASSLFVGAEMTT